MTTIEQLYAALETSATDEVQATSIRQPRSLRRAARLAVELGMDDSLTSATNRALEERIRAFARRRALAEHVERFPADRPQLAHVAIRRVSGTDHPATRDTALVGQVATWLEQQQPDWFVDDPDGAVEQVLGYVEMVAAGVADPAVATS
jgi:hypothetical protein